MRHGLREVLGRMTITVKMNADKVWTIDFPIPRTGRGLLVIENEGMPPEQHLVTLATSEHETTITADEEMAVRADSRFVSALYWLEDFNFAWWTP